MANRRNLLYRLRRGWRAFRQGYDVMPHGRKKRWTFLWPSFVSGKPAVREWGFYNYVHDGFNANSLIYSAIMYKVRAQMSAPLRAYRGGIDHPEPVEESHDLARLVARPNMHQSWFEFQGLNTVYLNLCGNVFILLERPPGGGIPRAMYSLRPDRVRIIPENKRGIKGYLYVPYGKEVADGIPILPQDIIHVKLPNPGDEFEGMGMGLSPIAALAHSGDTDNAVTSLLDEFFKRGMIPFGLIHTKTPVSDEEIQRIKQRWQEQYSGYENWTDIGVLDVDSEFERIAMNFDELGFDAIDERTESRILGPFGVPPILIGTRIGLMRSTYSNYEQARRAFWEDVFLPEMRMYEVEYRYYLRGEDDTFVAFDFSGVKALQRDITSLVDAAAKLIEHLVPPNAAYEIVGLPVEHLEHGDMSYMPLNLIPVGGERMAPRRSVGGMVEAEQQAEEAEKGKKKRRLKEFLNKEQKFAIWQMMDKKATSWEWTFGEAVNRAFESDKRALLAILEKVKKKNKERKSTVDWLEVRRLWDEYFDQASVTMWSEELTPVVRGVVIDQIEELAQVYARYYAVGSDPLSMFGEDWFRNYIMQFAQPIVDTTKQGIGNMLTQALKEGWNLEQMSDRLELMFEQWMSGDIPAEEFEWYEERMPVHRRELIARDQTMRASNAGAFQAYVSWGASMKEWLATQDNRVRDDHLEAMYRYSVGGEPGPIPINEPFYVGGWSMMFPGDGSFGAPLEQIIQCRCTIVPYEPEWEEW